MTIKQKLEAMRQRCEAATKAPWYVEGEEVRHDYDPYSSEEGIADHSVEICRVSRISEELDHRAKDRNFIAAARSDLPKLIEVVEVCLATLDYIIEHERFHGVNQGVDSDVKAEEALKLAEAILGREG